MTELSGPRVAPANGGPADALVVFLHGYGADGSDLIGLSEFFARALPGAAFVAPDAPGQMGMGGREWFPLTMRDPSEYRRGVAVAAPILQRFLDAELERHGLGNDRLALVGFSQGTMMALEVAYRRAERIAAVVGFSGALANTDPDALKPAPTLLVHGTADEVLPASMTEIAARALVAADVPVAFHMVPGLGHGIDQSGLTMAVNHLHQNLG
ncbi:alpha/beta fold hydrolase [Acuticoccus sp. MNP-M23]|uniref:alpha/beta hydrolase n=1 Tax=Acuticoccus sp. MNP-M23 TaxID=3072793 RepID=UPI0028163895|nr:alpha/beta fold hydrolase [Acuticoccus sp. MNP-M23]WMS41564.1 alpha/beta fold hydrolase [Acuticoccus sp. MNP-M23]